MYGTLLEFKVVIGILAAYFLLPVILIYAVQRFRRNMQIVPFDPKTVPDSKRMTRYFDESIEAMAEIGFECLGEFTLPDLMPNAKAVAQIYRNVTTRETAMVNSIWGIANGSVVARTRFAEFICRFDDPELQLIQTSNITMLGSFPDTPEHLTFRLPQMERIGDLYTCHTRLMERYAPNARRVSRLEEEFHGDPQSYLRQVVLVECFDRQISTGYLQTSEDGWRPTSYGAILMTWKELWPFKQLRIAALNRQGLKLEADLEDEFGPIPQ